MKKSSNLLRIISGMLCVLMLVCSLPIGALAAGVTVNTDNDDYHVVVSQKDYAISPGVTETNIIFNNESGQNQNKVYAISVAPDAEAEIMASYRNMDGNTWGTQVMSEQADAAERLLDVNVVGAINCNLRFSSNEPLGMLVINGTKYHDEVYQYGYFVVKADGTYEIRDNTEPLDGTEKQAITCFQRLIRDGQIVGFNVNDHSDSGRAPRTAIGIKRDGTLVLVVNDGRNYPTSSGFTMGELAQVMLDMGCYNAINCDGGGTSTFLSKREGTDKREVRNVPSDGSERPTLGGILVVSTARPSGEFDHASVTPNGDCFTKNARIDLAALGIDAAGAVADAIPETAEWQLPEEYKDMGTIENATVSGNRSTALFVPGGKTGTVRVDLVNEGTVLGSANFAIVEPDEVYFNAASVSLDFGQQSDLGLRVRKGGRDVIYGDNDFTWTVTSHTDGISDAAFGAMNGNLFVAGAGTNTMNGTVTVTCRGITASVSVEIGKMPFVALDFEPDADGNAQTCAHFDWGRPSTKTFPYQDYNGGGYRPKTDRVPLYSSAYPRWSADGTPASVLGTSDYPILFGGNYHYQNAPSAADVFNADGYSYYLWPNGTIREYEVGSIRTVTAAEGGQVRFGSSSLELNFDYRNYDGSANANFYVRYCGDPVFIPGAPKQVGMWVYADEKAQGLTIATDVGYWTGSDYRLVNCYLSPDGQGSKTSTISWTGWKYVYATLPDSVYQNLSDEHPLVLFPGLGIFWLSYQPGNKTAKRVDGTVYIDNLRFVYGSDKDDLTNPEVTSVTANGTELSRDTQNPTVIGSKDIEFLVSYNDPESANRSGINPTATLFQLDGFNFSGDCGDFSARTDRIVANGIHSFSVTVYDQFGNSVTETRYFIVEDSTQETSTVRLTGDKTVSMGSKYSLYVKASGIVADMSMSVCRLNSDFGKPEVVFADGWSGEAVYTSTGFKRAKLDIAATYEGTGTPAADTVIATITFSVPGTIDPEMDFFTYYTTTAMIKSDLAAEANTAAQPMVKLSVDANCTVEAGIAISGSDTVLTVRDKNGNPVSGANVYIITGGQADELIGTTDVYGRVIMTKTVSTNAGLTISVQVKNGEHVSYKKAVLVLGAAGNSEGKPSAVKLPAVGDLRNSKTMTWLSNPNVAAGKAYVQYIRRSDYNNGQCEFITVEGVSVLQGFNTSATAALINCVVLTGLEADTEYCYRVGDGTDGHWSEVYSFRTAKAHGTIDFIVVGDTQLTGNADEDREAIELLERIAQSAGEKDFGIQTGDYVDNGGNSAMWEQINDLFHSAFGGMSFIHTVGNHELMGDADASAAEKFFALTGRGYYSVRQGDVYIATISLGHDLEEALSWLIEDANRSNARWKILVIHQPAYYTNVSGGNDRYHELVPAAAEAAGIDVVFSGHDHSYARTEPLLGGKVNENGVVYFICGDLGEKSRDANYAAVNNPDFHFAMVSQEYGALYLECSAASDSLVITAYSIDADGNRTVLDTYTIENDECDTHDYEYDPDTEMLVCTVCRHEVAYKYYFGIYRKEGKYYYDYQGTDLGGWVQIGDDWHFFKWNSKQAAQGEYTVQITSTERVTFLFNEQGMTKGAWHRASDGGLRYYYGPNRYLARNPGYWTLVEIDGKTYNFDENGNVTYGEIQVLQYAASTRKLVYRFNDDGTVKERITDQGIIIDSKGDLYYIGENGEITFGNPGLVMIDGAIYDVKWSGKFSREEYRDVTAESANGLLAPGKYYFGADGKLQVLFTGVKTGEDGNLYYYVNDRVMTGKPGLVEVDGAIYDVKWSGKVAVNEYRDVTAERSNGLLADGKYYFGADGRLQVLFTGVKAGDDGILYYYVNGRIMKGKPGLVKVDGVIYDVKWSGKVAVNEYRDVTADRANGLLENGKYYFGADGRLQVLFTGVKAGDDGILYYYVNGIVKTGTPGLIEIDGVIYDVKWSGKVAVNEYRDVTDERSNGLLENGKYYFGADGKLVRE